MPTTSPGQSNSSNSDYISAEQNNNIVGNYYSADSVTMKSPKPVTVQDPTGKNVTYTTKDRQGKPSIFNRYSLFFYNSIEGNATSPESFFDSPGRLSGIGGPSGISSVLQNPTAKNIINWSNQGGNNGTNAVEYAWEDFLWCKNYGVIPNNYMVTLRRFSVPVSDDLLDNNKQPLPDTARMVTWIDGETNHYHDVGLQFTTSMNWQPLESEIQKIDASQTNPNYVNEGKLFGGKLGNTIKQFSALTQPGHGDAMRSFNPGSLIDPYQNKNVVYGPLDIIKKMNIRSSGLEFTQPITLTFEYELRSIDGINPKIAMIDLISNVLLCTANRGQFWGGEIRYYGVDPRRVKPLGDPSKAANGDYAGYYKSILGSIQSRVGDLTGGAGLSLSGIGNAIKNISGGLMDTIVGGGLDKLGRPGVAALSSLLSGEDTGEWHVMIGNPANPIMSIGNLILKNTQFLLSGALGPDDFPSKLKVECTLEPARPRDRSDIMSMFHRNGRTYLTVPPSDPSYVGNRVNGGQNGGTQPSTDKSTAIKSFGSGNQTPPDYGRFINWTGNDAKINITAQGIY